MAEPDEDDIDVLEQVAADAAPPIPTDQALREISEAAETMLRVEREVAEIEASLKLKKAEHLRLSTETIPTLMAGVRMTDFRLESGDRVQVKPLIGGHISVAAERDAHQWLRNHGHDEIIKNRLVCTFARGQDNVARNVVVELRDRGLDAEVETKVNHQTLGSWVRDMIRAGNEFDHELFGVFVGKTTKIVKGKSK